jgi:tetratricopeptide (TPR) repeat protein
MKKNKIFRPKTALVTSLVFIWRWMSSRKAFHLFGGLFAITGIGFLFFLIVEKRSKPFDVYQDRYMSLGLNALKSEQYPQAALYFRRVLYIDSDSDQAKFNLALIADQKGDQKNAVAMMARLSQKNSGNLMAPASFWLVTKILQSEKKLTQEQRLQVLKLLERVIAKDPQHLQARLLSIQFYSSIQLIDKAIAHAQAIVVKHPRFYLNLAKLSLAKGDRELAVSSARSASAFLKSKLETEPTNLGYRISLVEALRIQNKIDEAEEILLRGNKITPSKLINEQLSALYVLRASRSDNDINQTISQLKKALDWNPKSIAAYQLLGQLVSTSSDSGKEAIEILEQALVEGKTNSALVHTILGTAFLDQKNYESARHHLEMAHKLNPRMPIIINNLALALSSQKDPDLKRASKMIDVALEQAPNNVQIRESRGQIALRMKKWKEALSDFEYVMPVYSQNAQFQGELARLHRSMAIAYRNLGNESLAEKHDKMVKQFSDDSQ